MGVTRRPWTGGATGWYTSHSRVWPSSWVPYQVEILTHSSTHSLTHLLTHSLTHTPTHSLTHSPTHSLTHRVCIWIFNFADWSQHSIWYSCNYSRNHCCCKANESAVYMPTRGHSLTHSYSLTHLLTHSLTHFLTHLLTYSLTHSLTLTPSYS